METKNAKRTVLSNHLRNEVNSTSAVNLTKGVSNQNEANHASKHVIGETHIRIMSKCKQGACNGQ